MVFDPVGLHQACRKGYERNGKTVASTDPGRPQSSSYATRGGADPLAEARQGLWGGGVPQGEVTQAGPAQGGLDLGSLLQGILGGAGQAPQSYGQQASTAPIPAGLDLASLLQDGPGGTGQAGPSCGQQTGTGSVPAGLDLAGLLGGSPGDAGQGEQSFGQQAGTGSAPAGIDLGSLLQAILGGAEGMAAGAQTPPSATGGFGDVLGAVMGSGSSGMTSDPFLAPIVNGLTEKLGLPPQVLQAVVAFVMGKLLGERVQPGAIEFGVSAPTRPARGKGATLEDVRQKMNKRQRVTKKEIRSSGLARELSTYTGLDRATAEASLQQVLNELGGQLGAGM